MIKSKLSEIMGKRRIKMSELQKLTGLGVNTVRKIYYNTGHNVSYITLDKICEALDCKISDIIEYVPNKNPKIC